MAADIASVAWLAQVLATKSWHHGAGGLSIKGPVELASLPNPQDYNPFDPRARLGLQLFPAVLVAASLLANTLPNTESWLPRRVHVVVQALSPFISDEDLAASKLGRLSQSTGMLRRGAIQEQDGDESQYSNVGFKKQQRRVMLLCVIAVVESMTAFVSLGWSLAARPGVHVDQLGQVSLALTWIFIVCVTFSRPPTCAPVSTLVLVTLQFTDAAARVLETIPYLVYQGFGRFIFQAASAFFDVFLCLALAALILAMPVNPGGIEAQVPQRERDRLQTDSIVEETEDLRRDYELSPTTPEDYTSLASSLTYTWMEPLQRLSLKRPLLPTDIWRLRSINDTHLLSAKFAKVKSDKATGRPYSLSWRLLLCNANDIALDMTYKLCAVILAYAGPALMKAILQCISDAAAQKGTPVWTLSSAGVSRKATLLLISEEDSNFAWTPRSKAFVLAIFSLAFTLVRYIAELKNFHHARQVGLRIRSTLVVELFEKALKRRLTGATKHSEKDVDQGRKAQTTPRDGVSHTRKVAKQGKIPEGETTPLLGKKGDAEAAKKRDGSRTYGQSGDKERDAARADVGKLVNMMASDINTLLRLGCDSHQLYGAPLEVIIATTFLYRLLGTAAIVGLSILILGIPLSYFLKKLNVRAQQRWRAATDRRITLVAELIGAIRFIKIQGTQSKWTDRVMAARQKEMLLLIWVRINQLFFVLLWVGIPILSTVLTFYVYVVVEGNELTIPVAFTTLTLSAMLRTPLNTIPAFAMSIIQALVSVRRLGAFFEEEEVQGLVSSLKFSAKKGKESTPPREGLSVTHAFFSYSQRGIASDQMGKKCVLEDITLQFPTAGLCVIEGPTASGKSSLLSALLGELHRIKGEQTLPKFNSRGQSQMSFASQTPWLEAGKSVKDNIIFVTPWNRVRYDNVVEACALTEDLANFTDGDETRISIETLSGGQKARISLARALYHDGHTVLLDDILAAVDTRVQRHIVQNALFGPICQGRCVILATHHVSLVLPKAQYLVRLENGRIAAAGPPSELLQGQEYPMAEESSASSSSPSLSSQSSENAADTRSEKNNNEQSPPNTSPRSASGAQPTKKSTARLLYELEARQQGNVRWKSYTMYVRAAPLAIWSIIFIVNIVLRLNMASEQYWLKLWGEAYDRPAWNLPSASGHEIFYVAVYSLIGISTITLLSLRSIVFWIASYIASKKLYRDLLFSVVRARVRFFDRNPTGRILQRFNLDIGVLDSELPNNAMNCVTNILAFTTSALICIVIVPAFLVPVVLGVAFAIWGIQGFLKTTMYMQRIESTSTSPMYTAFTQILEGLMTVRAFGAEAYFLDRMQTITSITSAQWWAICTIEIWLSFRAQMISGLAVFLATSLALTGAVSPGSAGMVISSASLLTTIAYNLSYDYKVVSNNGNSVERIKEYIEADQEAPEVIKGNRVPAAWPSSGGGIDVRNLSVRYDADLPEVLHSLSFTIKPREKIAIVGRTGSGKTSCISALMRAVEPSSPDAAIIVDGLDILKLGLEYRSRISVVPQDPVLFSGTIRQNLDPFDEKSDEECQWALDRVGINRNSLTPAPDQAMSNEGPMRERIYLSTIVESCSSNLSAGQAQLICLARAVLRDARIVILDEATSQTDAETDQQVQQAIREMRDSIIIAVAHRLSTVIDYDRILVMSRGHIVEYDSPRALLSKRDDDESAHFKKMCKEAGHASFRRLCDAADMTHSQ